MNPGRFSWIKGRLGPAQPGHAKPFTWQDDRITVRKSWVKHAHLLLWLIPVLHAEPPAAGLLVDLDASKGVEIEDGNRVSRWVSDLSGKRFEFIKRDEGRKEPGSGRPTLRRTVDPLGGKPALEFLQQELVCLDEDAFDSLTTGKGHTWAAVVAFRSQRVGVKDVNSFFGNLRNGEKYEGFWGCVTDDNRPWYGVRNGLTFGRFDVNNPQLLAPFLDPAVFHLLIGRMQAGVGDVKLELFVNAATPVAVSTITVRPEANPSRLAIGQERDAVNHPGYESFDGDIARFLVWERPLDDSEVANVVSSLRKLYLVK